MASAVQRKKHYVTYSNNPLKGFPDFLGAAKISGIQYGYYYKGIPFPAGRYEFEITTIVVPKGFANVKDDGSKGAAVAETFVMPFLADMVPEGDQPNFPYDQWHYCQSGGGDMGTFACAKPLTTTQTGRRGELKPRQIVFFYDDTETRLIPYLKNNPDDDGTPRDPNHRYYFLPMLLPNQSLCYYLLPENVEVRDGIIKKWNDKIATYVGVPFFVAVNKSLIFEDSLQLFFTDEVGAFWEE